MLPSEDFRLYPQTENLLSLREVSLQQNTVNQRFMAAQGAESSDIDVMFTPSP